MAAMGQRDRDMASARLGGYFSALIMRSDAELLQLVQEKMKSVNEATRDECLKFLVMDFVDENFCCFGRGGRDVGSR
jgi:hypothetical protein